MCVHIYIETLNVSRQVNTCDFFFLKDELMSQGKKYNAKKNYIKP